MIAMKITRTLLPIILLGAFGSEFQLRAQVRNKGVDPEWAAKVRQAPGMGIYSHNLPRDLFLAIYDRVSPVSKPATVFAPNGGWIVFGAYSAWFKATNLPVDLTASLKGADSTVYQVAIGPNGAWLYVSGVNGKTVKEKNLPPDMHNKIWELYNEDRGRFENQNQLRQIGFAPNGGWFITYLHTTRTQACGLCMPQEKRGSKIAYNNLPPSVESKIRELLGSGEVVHRLAFAPNGGWLIIDGHGRHYYDGIGDDLIKTLAELKKGISEVTLGPNGSWVIVTGN